MYSIINLLQTKQVLLSLSLLNSKIVSSFSNQQLFSKLSKKHIWANNTYLLPSDEVHLPHYENENIHTWMNSFNRRANISRDSGEIIFFGRVNLADKDWRKPQI